MKNRFLLVVTFCLEICKTLKQNSKNYAIDFIATCLFISVAHPIAEKIPKINGIKTGERHIVGQVHALKETNGDNCIADFVVEINLDTTNKHRISIAQFKRDLTQQKNSFNGTNYRNDGKSNAQWTTNSLSIDSSKEKIEYSYWTTYVNNNNKKVGSGEIYFSSVSNFFTFGSFKDDGTEIIHAKYFNLHDIERKLNYFVNLNDPDSVAEFIKKVLDSTLND